LGQEVNNESIAAAARRVRAYWDQLGVSGGLYSPAEIEEAEVRLGRLPDEFKTFLATAGEQTSEDENGMLFWPPDRLRTAHEVLTEAGHPVDVSTQAIVIADHMQESWWYVLWIGGPRTGRVSLVLGGDPNDFKSQIAALDEFLNEYVADGSRLCP
jgi:hypothetical protein